MKRLWQKIRDKVAYERESYRMSSEYLREIAEEFPFPPFWQRIRMTDADLARWRREQRR